MIYKFITLIVIISVTAFILGCGLQDNEIDSRIDNTVPKMTETGYQGLVTESAGGAADENNSAGIFCANDKDAELDKITWSQKFVGSSGGIWSHDDFVYYISVSGDIIFKCTAETEPILFYKTEEGAIDFIYINEKWLYYKIIDKQVIYRVHLENGSLETVFDLQKIEESDKVMLNDMFLHYINGLFMYNEILYMYASTCCYGYNINSGKLFLLNTDISSGAFIKNKFYFTEHAGRSFTIYETDLETGNTQIVRGGGVSFEFGEIPGRMMYDNLAAFNGNLFYHERTTNSVYMYTDSGNDILIKNLSEETCNSHFSFGTDNQDLYFTQDYPNVIYKIYIY